MFSSWEITRDSMLPLPVIVLEELNQTLSFKKSDPSTTLPAVGFDESYKIGVDSSSMASPAPFVTLNFTK